jgi:hypothetical protein
VVRFLKHLLGQIPAKLLLIWDGSPIHRGRAVKVFLASGASRRLKLEQLPFSTHPISRPRSWDLYKHLKYVELKNVCRQSLKELKVELRKAKERLRHKRERERERERERSSSVASDSQDSRFRR